MILRKAKLDDFKDFKRLYEDKENLYQFLYNRSTKENTSVSTENQWTLDDSFSELCSNYTIEQFQKDLENSSLLYMIEDSSEIIGYMNLFYSGYNTYKIAEWAMFNPEDDYKKVEILNCLKKLKLPRLRKFSVCTVNDDIVKFLFSNGFHSSHYSFYEIEI